MLKPEILMLVGLPSSGKSVYAKQRAREGYIVHSSDSVREELGDIADMTKNEEVFEILHKRIKADLRSGKSVVYDATNIKWRRRKSFLEELRNIECSKVCHLIYKPYEQCLESNEAREHSIPNEVIKRMYLGFNIPYYYEGWDKIEVVGEVKYLNSQNKLNDLCDFSQDNHNHSLSLGDHLCATMSNITKYTRPFYDIDSILDLMDAARLHDIGKPFTKSFTNASGEKTEDSHYYNHHLCGAYDSLQYDSYHTGDILKRAILIMWHMQPYFWKKDNIHKQLQKYKKLWGNELFKELMILHKADKEAH